jgi:hypothetical protein
MAKDLALEREWRERLKRHEESGLSIQAFCQQEGVPAPRFSWWRAELKRRDAKAKPPTKQKQQAKTTRKAPRRSKPANGAFVPVELATAAASSASVEIVLDDPPRIAVTAGFDPQLLADVLRVLEERSC